MRNEFRRRAGRIPTEVRPMEEVWEELLKNNVENYGNRDRIKLYIEFIYLCEKQPEIAKETIGEDTVDEGGTSLILRRKDIPLDLIRYWYKRRKGKWEYISILADAINGRVLELSVSINTPRHTQLLSELRSIDPELVPEKDRGAGQRGMDKEIMDLYTSYLPIVKELRSLYRKAVGKRSNFPERIRLSKVEEVCEIVFLGDNRLLRPLLESLARELGVKYSSLDNVPKEIINAVDLWIPRDGKQGQQRMETAESLMVRKIASWSGLRPQTVRNAIKRARRDTRLT